MMMIFVSVQFIILFAFEYNARVDHVDVLEQLQCAVHRNCIDRLERLRDLRSSKNAVEILDILDNLTAWTSELGTGLLHMLNNACHTAPVYPECSGTSTYTAQ